MNAVLTERFFEALVFYNRGDYFAAQELLEPLHAECEPDDQAMVRAMAMLATAMHLHFNRGGGRGVVNLLRQCLLLLDDRRPESLGVDVADLHEALEAYLQEILERKKAGAGFFDRWLRPRVRFGGSGREL
jgi:predicted metal-dependent hydrolase